MVNLRLVLYNALLLSAAVLPLAGCGESAGPPPGAPKTITAPTVDPGSEAGAADPAAGATGSAPASPTSSAQKGEAK
jgi:hypothetical protein